MPEADMKIITFVKEAADRFSMLGATVEEVSVPMHFDGEVLPAIFPFVNSIMSLSSFCLHVNLTTTNFVPLYLHTGIRICDAICLEGGYRLLHGECPIVSLSSILMFDHLKKCRKRRFEFLVLMLILNF